MEDKKQSARLSYIDGLKGLLVIPIFLYHYYTVFCEKDVTSIPFSPAALFVKGFLAVELYFAISGFLIARKYSELKNGITLHQYITPKLKRIMPCFFVSNLIVMVCAIIEKCFVGSKLMPTPNLWAFFASCTPFYTGWITNDGPIDSVGWFISVLFLCYIIYYFLCKVKKKQTYFIICCLIILVGINGYQLDFSLPFLYKQACRGYMAFFVGVLMFHLLTSEFNKKGIAVAGIAFLAILLPFEVRFNNVVGNATFFTIFIIIPILMLAVTSIKWVQKILSARPVLHLGRMSMSIYLIHHPIMRAIKLEETSRWGGGRTI